MQRTGNSSDYSYTHNFNEIRSCQLNFRWFDKSISLIVAKDGTAAISFEHSWGDGVAVLRYFNEIYADSMSSSFIHPNSIPEDSKAVSTVVQPIGTCLKII